ncbi:MAG TPA: hypothetical protein VLQ65_09895 [Saliniramus sp.]|nr:hypothetical protein [Saliniramus sp.]
MSATTIAVLARDPELQAMFKKDPIGALDVIAKRTGAEVGRISKQEIEVIRNLSQEEFEMFYGVIEKMKRLNVKSFKI